MARTSRSPDNAFAGEGSVRQEGPLPIYLCNACQAPVVWATSKTGKKYLVNVVRGYMDQRYYRKNNVHKCNTTEGK